MTSTGAGTAWPARGRSSRCPPGSSRPTRSPSSPSRSTCPPARSRRPCNAGTRTPRRTSTPTSGEAQAPLTSGGVTRSSATGRLPPSGHLTQHPITRSVSTAAASAPRAVPRPTTRPASSTSTVRPSRGCTRRATPWPPWRWGCPTAARAARSARRSSGDSWPASTPRRTPQSWRSGKQMLPRRCYTASAAEGFRSPGPRRDRLQGVQAVEHFLQQAPVGDPLSLPGHADQVLVEQVAKQHVHHAEGQGKRGGKLGHHQRALAQAEDAPVLRTGGEGAAGLGPGRHHDVDEGEVQLADGPGAAASHHVGAGYGNRVLCTPSLALRAP